MPKKYSYRQLYHLTLGLVVSLSVLCLSANNTHAEEFGTPTFLFSGFGTLGATHSGEDQADFTSSLLKPDGAGYSHDWSTAVDSLIGVQLITNLNPQLSAVVQVITEQNYDNTYRPHVEWANIKYLFTPDFSMRVGRIVLPGLLLSDTRKVGYTYPWIRPPLEVYTFNPVTNNDGVDASYRLHFGETVDTMQANIGGSNPKLPIGGTAKARKAWGISNTIESGPLTAQITYQKLHLTIAALSPLFDAFRPFGPQGAALADKYAVNDKPQSFLGIGASYDPGNWFVTGEWATVTNDSFIGKNVSWYTGGGYRFGKFTPFMTYARQRATDKSSDPGLDSTIFPAAIGLNAALNSVLSSKTAKHTVSVGVRWDFMKNTDLKLQFDHTRNGPGSPGGLINTQSGFLPGGSFNVSSAAINFVF